MPSEGTFRDEAKRGGGRCVENELVLNVDKSESDVSSWNKGDCYPLDQPQTPHCVKNFCKKVSLSGSFFSRSRKGQGKV